MDLYNTNLNILRNASDKALNIIKDLYNLEYFDKTNYENNIKDFSFAFINDNDNKDLAIYSPMDNKIFIRENMLYEELLNEEYTCMLILHELVRLSSYNKKTNMIGFVHEAVPYTYNEGCTQYLTLKLLYKDKLEERIEKNTINKESVDIIKSSIDALGEKTIFNGFFEADLKKSVDGFTPKVLDKWIDYVMVLDHNLKEELGILEENTLEEEHVM